MSLLTDDRTVNLGSIRLFGPGQGEPQVTRRVRKFYSVAEEVWNRQASCTLDANGIPLLEFLPGCGIVNRAFVTPQDTRLSHFSTSGGGSWAEERPGTGAPRKYRLVQYNTTGSLQFAATWTYNFPANPSFAFSLILPDTPPDHDASTYPPFARCEFASGRWAVQVGKEGSAYLLKRIAGIWTAVQELPAPYTGGYVDVQELVFIVRVHRGRLFISSDGGKTYTPYSEASALSIPTGNVVFRGQGGAMAFGLHQVVYTEGILTSAPRFTFGDYSALTPTIDGKYALPASTSITFGDASSSGQAQWRATLTPASTAIGGPWNFYSAPEFYGVRFRYAGATSAALGSFSTPFDNIIRSAAWTKPFELDQAKLAVTIYKDSSALIWNPGRYARIAYYRGEESCAGVESWEVLPAFVGYIEPFEIGTQSFNDAALSFTVQNVSIKLKRAKWTPLDRSPLGGQSVNAALDEILASEGIDTSFRSWHARGDTVILPEGAPEDPFEYPRDGESKWETMTRIAGHAGVELGVTDDGTFFSARRNFLTGVSHILDVAPTDELRRAIERANLRFDSSQNYSAVFVTGTLDTGETALAVAIDSAAETDPLSYRFNGLGRDTLLDEMQGSCTAGLMALRAQSLAEDAFALAFEPDLQIPVPNMDIVRRDTVYLVGLDNIGISSADAWVVLSVTHEQMPNTVDSKTTLGVRRL